MKFHRVLLFTTIQMDITPVGDDLHILLTGGDKHRIGCTAFSVPKPTDDLGDLDKLFDAEAGAAAGTTQAETFSAVLADTAASNDSAFECDTTIIKSDDNADASFCAYVAKNIAKQTGKRTLCTGGVYVDNPDEHQIRKLYENIDEMIMDWANFLTD